jgi:hypothetical protein
MYFHALFFSHTYPMVEDLRGWSFSPGRQSNEQQLLCKYISDEASTFFLIVIVCNKKRCDDKWKSWGEWSKQMILTSHNKSFHAFRFENCAQDSDFVTFSPLWWRWKARHIDHADLHRLGGAGKMIYITISTIILWDLRNMAIFVVV